ncbi:MAG: hypothetical protein JO347_09645 [Candidatus Eremiobacteraeota bacterium]|nr:hypothetical protein [Candidatus Eremiobacteraeota bacterium]
MIDLIDRKNAESRLRRLYEKTLALEDEGRRRIAKELYDSTSQQLAALKINLAVIRKSSRSLGGKAERALNECLTLAQACTQEIRRLSHLLHPPMLDEFGLEFALRGYLDAFCKRNGIRVRFAYDEALARKRMPRKVETALFRVVQEALSNVQLRSGSRAATVELRRAETTPHVTVLRISDRGHGISQKVVRALERDKDELTFLGIGLLGIRERITQLGGTLRVNTGKSGTVIIATLPWSKSTPLAAFRGKGGNRTQA